MQLTVTVESSAASLPGWDELVIGAGIELPSHELWLSAKVLHLLEVFGNKTPLHVLARVNGTLLGGLATYRVDDQVTDELMRLGGVFPGMDVLPDAARRWTLRRSHGCPDPAEPRRGGPAPSS